MIETESVKVRELTGREITQFNDRHLAGQRMNFVMGPKPTDNSLAGLLDILRDIWGGAIHDFDDATTEETRDAAIMLAKVCELGIHSTEDAINCREAIKQGIYKLHPPTRRRVERDEAGNITFIVDEKDI